MRRLFYGHTIRINMSFDVDGVIYDFTEEKMKDILQAFFRVR